MNRSMRHVHSQRLERWLGTEKIERLSRDFRDWYGPPVNLRDVPGSVWVTRGGEFVGDFGRGYFGSAFDAFADWLRRLDREISRPQRAALAVGFGGLGDALTRASQGNGQLLGQGPISKTGATGVANVTSTLWRLGSQPQAGGAPSAAPGGRIPTSGTAGALPYANPSSGTLHLTGADMSASVANNCLMLYDRLFDVLKTMNSTSTESVTGVPTRYQNTSASASDYIGGNFLFIEVGGTALAATAHNWTVCTYQNQANSGATLPSLTGNASAIVDRLDHPTNSWFAPLAAGDTGIKALTQMQCSAAVATGVINFVIGHPIGIMTFPIAGPLLPFDWLTNRNQAPRIFDNACLSLLELSKPSTTATTYGGMLYATGAAP